MKTRSTKTLFALSLALLGGCDAQKNEAANLHEYSILQALEYQYRDLDHREPYLIVPNALGSEATAIAFPVAGSSKGYVFMLANANGAPKDKRLPEADFVVTRGALSAVKRAAQLSPEVESAIAARSLQGTRE